VRDDFVKRPEDVIRAVRELRRLGLSVSLPYQTASGEMFFEIDGHVLTVAQMLKLMDQNQLGSRGSLSSQCQEKGMRVSARFLRALARSITEVVGLIARVTGRGS